MASQKRAADEAFAGSPDSYTPPETLTRPMRGGLGSALTKREQEVLELMAFGLSNKEIAHRLGLGRRTVETHINHVLGKLEVSSRTRAWRRGLTICHDSARSRSRRRTGSASPRTAPPPTSTPRSSQARFVSRRALASRNRFPRSTCR